MLFEIQGFPKPLRHDDGMTMMPRSMIRQQRSKAYLSLFSGLHVVPTCIRMLQ